MARSPDHSASTYQQPESPGQRTEKTLATADAVSEQPEGYAAADTEGVDTASLSRTAGLDQTRKSQNGAISPGRRASLSQRTAPVDTGQRPAARSTALPDSPAAMQATGQDDAGTRDEPTVPLDGTRRNAEPTVPVVVKAQTARPAGDQVATGPVSALAPVHEVRVRVVRDRQRGGVVDDALGVVQRYDPAGSRTGQSDAADRGQVPSEETRRSSSSAAPITEEADPRDDATGQAKADSGVGEIKERAEELFAEARQRVRERPANGTPARSAVRREPARERPVEARDAQRPAAQNRESDRPPMSKAEVNARLQFVSSRLRNLERRYPIQAKLGLHQEIEQLRAEQWLLQDRLIQMSPSTKIIRAAVRKLAQTVDNTAQAEQQQRTPEANPIPSVDLRELPDQIGIPDEDAERKQRLGAAITTAEQEAAATSMSPDEETLRKEENEKMLIYQMRYLLTKYIPAMQAMKTQLAQGLVVTDDGYDIAEDGRRRFRRGESPTIITWDNSKEGINLKSSFRTYPSTPADFDLMVSFYPEDHETENLSVPWLELQERKGETTMKLNWDNDPAATQILLRAFADNPELLDLISRTESLNSKDLNSFYEISVVMSEGKPPSFVISQIERVTQHEEWLEERIASTKFEKRIATLAYPFLFDIVRRKKIDLRALEQELADSKEVRLHTVTYTFNPSENEFEGESWLRPDPISVEDFIKISKALLSMAPTDSINSVNPLEEPVTIPAAPGEIVATGDDTTDPQEGAGTTRSDPHADSDAPAAADGNPPGNLRKETLGGADEPRRNAVAEMVLASVENFEELNAPTQEEGDVRFKEQLIQTLEKQRVRRPKLGFGGVYDAVHPLTNYPDVVVKRTTIGAEDSETRSSNWATLQRDHALIEKWLGRKFVPYTEFVIVNTDFGDPNYEYGDLPHIAVQEKVFGQKHTANKSMDKALVTPEVIARMKPDVIELIHRYEQMMRIEQTVPENQIAIDVTTGDIKLFDTNLPWSFQKEITEVMDLLHYFGVDSQAIETPEDAINVLTQIPAFSDLREANYTDILAAFEESSKYRKEFHKSLKTDTTLIAADVYDISIALEHLINVIQNFPPDGEHNRYIRSLMGLFEITNEELAGTQPIRFPSQQEEIQQKTDLRDKHVSEMRPAEFLNMHYQALVHQESRPPLSDDVIKLVASPTQLEYQALVDSGISPDKILNRILTRQELLNAGFIFVNRLGSGSKGIIDCIITDPGSGDVINFTTRTLLTRAEIEAVYRYQQLRADQYGLQGENIHQVRKDMLSLLQEAATPDTFSEGLDFVYAVFLFDADLDQINWQKVGDEKDWEKVKSFLRRKITQYKKEHKGEKGSARDIYKAVTEGLVREFFADIYTWQERPDNPFLPKTVRGHNTQATDTREGVLIGQTSPFLESGFVFKEFFDANVFWGEDTDRRSSGQSRINSMTLHLAGAHPDFPGFSEMGGITDQQYMPTGRYINELYVRDDVERSQLHNGERAYINRGRRGELIRMAQQRIIDLANADVPEKRGANIVRYVRRRILFRRNGDLEQSAERNSNGGNANEPLVSVTDSAVQRLGEPQINEGKYLQFWQEVHGIDAPNVVYYGKSRWSPFIGYYRKSNDTLYVNAVKGEHQARSKWFRNRKRNTTTKAFLHLSQHAADAKLRPVREKIEKGIFIAEPFAWAGVNYYINRYVSAGFFVDGAIDVLLLPLHRMIGHTRKLSYYPWEFRARKKQKNTQLRDQYKDIITFGSEQEEVPSEPLQVQAGRKLLSVFHEMVRIVDELANHQPANEQPVNSHEDKQTLQVQTIDELMHNIGERAGAAEDSTLSPKVRKAMREEALRISQTIVEQGDETQIAAALSLLDTNFQSWLQQDRSDKHINYELYGAALAMLAHNGNPEQRARALEQIQKGILAREKGKKVSVDREILRKYFSYTKEHNQTAEVQQILDGLLMPLYQSHGFSEEDYQRITKAHRAAIDQGFYNKETIPSVFEYDTIRTLDEAIPGASRALYDRRGIKVFTRFNDERLVSIYRNLDAPGRRFFVGLAESDNGMMFNGRDAVEKLLRTIEKTRGIDHVDIWELSSGQQEQAGQTTPEYSFTGAIQASAAQYGRLLGGFILAHGNEYSITFGTDFEKGRIRQGDFTSGIVAVLTNSFVPETSLFFASCETANAGGIIEDASNHLPNFILYGAAGRGQDTMSILRDLPKRLTRSRTGGYNFYVPNKKRARIAGFRNGSRIV